MLKIFIPNILHFFIASILKNIGIEINNYLILLTMLATSLILLTLDKKYTKFIFVTYIFRIIIMYFNIYYNHIFELPHTGDSEAFYSTGLEYMNSGNILKGNLYGGLYTKFIGIILRFIGESREYIQHINIIFGIFSILVLIKLIDYYFEIKDKSGKKYVIIYSFMPMSMIISSVVMRESIIIFFISLSLLFFVKFYKQNKIMYILFCFLFTIFGALFHSGVFFILFGYIYILLLKEKLVTNKNFLIFVLIIIFGIVVISMNKDIIFKKLLSNGEINISYGNYKGAGSKYLKNNKINSFSDAVIYSPLRAFYFVFSPTPLYWRGLSDVITFFVDSIIYILIIKNIIFYIFNRKKINNVNDKLIMGLIFSVIIFVFVFGIGVNNSGTAIRHRNKILIIFTFINILILEAKKMWSKEYNHDKSNDLANGI